MGMYGTGLTLKFAMAELANGRRSADEGCSCTIDWFASGVSRVGNEDKGHCAPRE